MVLYEWSIESLGLFDHHHQTDRHQSSARAVESRRLCVLLNLSRGTLMRYSDRSDDDPLQIQGAYMTNGSTRQMIHPIRSKRALRNEMPLCVAQRRTVLLCLYIFVGKIEQNKQHCV